MAILLNAIILIFEVLYYSLFMYFSKKEGKFWKYLINFLLITIIGLFIGTNNLLSYLLLVLLMFLGLKYIVNVKMSLYDMLIIVIMLFFKMFIEFIIYFPLSIIGDMDYILSTIIFETFKNLFLIVIASELNGFYKGLKKVWDQNNFYIRYIFSCCVYIYIIATVVLMIFC